MGYNEVLEMARHMRQNPTPAEQVFWEKVRNKRFLGRKFYRQYIIEYCEIIGVKSHFIADFYCYHNRVIVEIDGDVHDFQKQYDKKREDILKAIGFQIIRFRNEDVLFNWDQTASKLVHVLA